MRSVTADPTNELVTGDRHVGVAIGKDSLPDSPIRPEPVLPMNSWIASSYPAEPEAIDYAQQHQQQQQQQ